MERHDFDLEAYLQRIRFSGSTDVSLDTLARLHRAHFHAIPFENFDILLGRGIENYDQWQGRGANAAPNKMNDYF